MGKVSFILLHEFVKHVRRPGFLLATFLLPFFGVIVVAVLTLSEEEKPSLPEIPESIRKVANMDDDDEEEPPTVGYVDHAGILVYTPDYSTTTKLRAFPTESQAQAAVQRNEIQAYYVVHTDYLTTGQVTRYADYINFVAPDRGSFGMLLRVNLLESNTITDVRRIVSPLTVSTIRLDEAGQPIKGRYSGESMEDNPDMFFLPYGFALLLYMTIFASAGLLLNSVLEEKENRMMEVLLTSVQPWHMLAGKILGLGLLGLFQMAVWVGSAAALLEASAMRSDVLSHVDLPLYVWVLIVPYFVLSYFLYGSLMAGIGAVVTSTREGSLLTTMLVVPVMLPILFIMVIVEHPDGVLSVLLSMFPLTASITMIMRLTLTDVVWWQLALSLAALLGGVVLAIWLSARLFRTTTLLAGKKLSFREIGRALWQS